MEIIYRIFNIDSDSEIMQWLDLYRVCFKKEISREFWHWAHLENPFYKKTKPLIFIAESDGKIVGSVSLIPSPIQIHHSDGDSVLNSCLLCKAMVHPEFRNRGIFHELNKNAINVLKSEGYDIILTVSNNPFSYRSFLKAGFQDITSMNYSKLYLFIDEVLQKYILQFPQTIRKIIVLPVSSLYSVLIPHHKHNFQMKFCSVEECSHEIEYFYHSSASENAIYGIRSIPFIKWRFSRPGKQFKCLSLWEENTMLAYLVLDFLDGKRSALIADMRVRDNDESLIALIASEAIQYCENKHLPLLLSYLIERDGTINRFFSFRNGFVERSSSDEKLPKSRFLCYPLNEKHESGIFSDKNRWNIMSVDTCLFW